MCYEHVVDLLVRDAVLPQVGQDVIVDVQVVPLGHHGEHVRVDPVDVASRVVGEDHAIRVTPATHLCHRVGPGLERGSHIDPEAIHPQNEPLIGQLGQVIDVRTVAAVTEHYAAGIHALLVAHELLHSQPGLAPGVRVHGDRRPGLTVGFGDRSHHPGYAVGHPLVVDGALEEGGLHARTSNALSDVTHEHLNHRVRDIRAGNSGERRPPVVEEEGNLVVGVATGGGDYVQLGDLIGDLLYAGYVPAQADNGRVGDAPDTLSGERLEFGDGVHDAVFLPSPFLRIVLLHVGIEHEDVLVHVGPAELRRVDGPSHRLHCGHARSLS